MQYCLSSLWDTNYGFAEVLFCYLISDSPSSFFTLDLVSTFHFMCNDPCLSMLGGAKTHVVSGLSIPGPHCRVTAGEGVSLEALKCQDPQVFSLFLVSLAKEDSLRLLPGFLHSGQGLEKGKGMSLIQKADFHLIPVAFIQYLTPVCNVPEHRSWI